MSTKRILDEVREMTKRASSVKCIRLRAHGFSRESIARELGITLAQVDYRLYQAKRVRVKRRRRLAARREFERWMETRGDGV